MPHVAIANPWLTVVTPLSEETQVAVFVRSRKVPSVYVPMAVNCLVNAGHMIVAAAGVTSMETSAGGVIVSVAPVEVIPEELAVIVVVPS
jgi:hypothetical protein